MATFLNAVFGSKPSVAKFKKLKLNEEQKKSITGNIEAFPEIQKLGDLYKNFMVSQQESLLPGYTAGLAKGQAAANQLLDLGSQFATGEIPKDVQDKIQRTSAFQSLSGGYAGSGMARNLTARDFGLTSLDMIGKGADLIGRGGNTAQQWAAMARGDIMNPAASFVNPKETADFDLQNSILKQQSQQYANNIAAAPDPVAKGISDTIINLVGAYLGAGKGGGGGGVAPNYNAASYGGSGMSNYNYTTPTNQFYDTNWATSASGYG